MNTPQQKQRLQTAMGALVLFGVCFTLFSSMRNRIWFMDEMDNFYIGLQMAQGAVLYDTVFSQHMPLMYYLCAAFAKLGAHTVLQFRLYWYVFLSLCYVAVYLRYSKWYGRTALALWPVFYLLAVTNVPLCTSILAEQLQALGMVLLMLEFLRFTETRAVSSSSAVCIALGINLAFLSAFVAAFACAGIVLAYGIAELAYCVHGKMHPRAAAACLWKKYRLTIGLTLLPMALFALHFLWLGNFDDFLYKAYTLNREVYSKYQGGFGTSPLSALTGCVTLFVALVKQLIQTLFQGAHNLAPACIGLFFAFIAFLFSLLAHKRRYAAVVLGVFFLLCGSRGFYNYHSLQIFALSALALALLVGNCRRAARRSAPRRGMFTVLSCVLCFGFIGVSAGPVFANRASLYPRAAEFAPYYEAHSLETLINTLTEPGEYILENINYEHLFLETHARAPVYNTACSPWWWEPTRERAMREIRANPPRIAVFDPEYTTWGYQVKDFAPEMTAFVAENYTQLYQDAPELYVRNDVLPEMRAKLPADDSSMVACVRADRTCGDTLPVDGVTQRFIATRGQINTLSLQFATHSRPYTGTVRVALREAESGREIAAYEVAGKDITDNGFTLVQTAQMPPVMVNVGESYVVTVVARHAKDDNLTLWASEGDATPACYAWLNGTRQSYNLRIKVR